MQLVELEQRYWDGSSCQQNWQVMEIEKLDWGCPDSSWENKQQINKASTAPSAFLRPCLNRTHQTVDPLPGSAVESSSFLVCAVVVERAVDAIGRKASTHTPTGTLSKVGLFIWRHCPDQSCVSPPCPQQRKITILFCKTLLLLGGYDTILTISQINLLGVNNKYYVLVSEWLNIMLLAKRSTLSPFSAATVTLSPGQRQGMTWCQSWRADS